MTTALFLIALALVILDTAWRARRHGGMIQPVALARAVGIAAGVLYILVEGSSFWIDFAWWRNLGQAPTFWQFLRIRWLPQVAMAVLGGAVLVVAFALARRACGTKLAGTRLFGGAGYVIAALVGVLLSVNIVDPWTIVLFLGSRSTGTYTDPMFHKDLAFYFFRLPFYEMAFFWLGAMAVGALIVAGVTMVAGTSADRVQEWRARMQAQMEGRGYAGSASGAGTSARAGSGGKVPFAGLLRTAAVLVLVLFAAAQWFARYGLLYSSHRFLTGADFVDARLGIPLLWVQIVGALLLAVVVVAVRQDARGGLRSGLGRRSHGLQARAWSEAVERWSPANAPHWLAPAVVAVFLVLAIAPSLIQAVVRSVYVSPNELTLERPYIADHIQATRRAFNLEQASHEEAFSPRATDTLDLNQYPDTASNLRLWDEKPFQDDSTQLQALRPYYSFPNVDVDRYHIGGQTRQVLIAARALDTSLLPQTAQSWVNLSLQFTHGYGAVAAMVNSATPEGQPDMILKDAPPVTSDPALAITRAGLYFGEDTSRPVYVDTKQDEFDYPKGDDNSYTNYSGSAGIVLANPMLRLAASIEQNDANVLLTRYFTPQTRLLMHRQIVDRVQTLVPFLTLDPDPYLVVDSHGHMFWMLDAYTTSDLHPYAQPTDLGDAMGDAEVNYIRNSVKITVDAYNGSVHMYVFDAHDPILADYAAVFPSLFEPRSAMPTDLLAHIRYPKLLFSAQAETYRLYHMQDPQVFYNKEDQWDLARQVVTQEDTEPTNPYYVMLRLPGDTQAEFVLLVPFTSHSRDNLIAWVAARCDPDHYGQLIFYRLPKEQLIYGPLQIESRVDQDRTISKDLSLWNQQGSRVIRATTLVLPVGGTFLYVEPIYIQAPQARLPELKKVVLAVGNRLVYSDDLPTAIATLAQASGNGIDAGGTAVTTTATSAPVAATVAQAAAGGNVSRAVLESIEGHLARYRALTAQGQFAQAGAELQAAQDELQKAIGRH